MRFLVTILLLFTAFITNAQSQNGINWDRYYITGSLAIGKDSNVRNDDGSYVHPSALFQVGRDTTKKGVILSRVAHQDSIPSPVRGLLTYSYSCGCYVFYNGAAWTRMSGNLAQTLLGGNTTEGTNIMINGLASGMEPTAAGGYISNMVGGKSGSAFPIGIHSIGTNTSNPGSVTISASDASAGAANRKRSLVITSGSGANWGFYSNDSIPIVYGSTRKYTSMLQIPDIGYVVKLIDSLGSGGGSSDTPTLNTVMHKGNITSLPFISSGGSFSPENSPNESGGFSYDLGDNATKIYSKGFPGGSTKVEIWPSYSNTDVTLAASFGSDLIDFNKVLRDQTGSGSTYHGNNFYPNGATVNRLISDSIAQKLDSTSISGGNLYDWRNGDSILRGPVNVDTTSLSNRIDQRWIIGTSTATVNNLAFNSFFGTTSNMTIRFVTNGVERGFISNIGIWRLPIWDQPSGTTFSNGLHRMVGTSSVSGNVVEVNNSSGTNLLTIPNNPLWAISLNSNVRISSIKTRITTDSILVPHLDTVKKISISALPFLKNGGNAVSTADLVIGSDGYTDVKFIFDTYDTVMQYGATSIEIRDRALVLERYADGDTGLLYTNASGVVLRDTNTYTKVLDSDYGFYTGDPSAGTIVIPHSLGTSPGYVSISFADYSSEELTSYTTVADATTITITFSNPPSETELGIWWEVKKPK